MKMFKIVIVLLNFLPSLLLAAEDFKFPEPVKGFQNKENALEYIFIGNYSENKANVYKYTLSLNTKEPLLLGAFTFENGCTPSAQSNSFLDGGKELVGNFLVGLGSVCELDFSSQKVNFINNFTLPEDSFSVFYVFSEQAVKFFVVNSLPFDGIAQTGFLHGISLNQESKEISVFPLLKNVPGYSGAIAKQGNTNNILLNSATGNLSNNLYSAEQNGLQNLLKQNKLNSQLEFSDFYSFFSLKKENIQGLSFYMLSSNNVLAYVNSYSSTSYESFTHNLRKQETQSLVSSCLPIGVSFVKKLEESGSQRWLSLCNSQTIQISKMLK
jgi:hypothetical protein